MEKFMGTPPPWKWWTSNSFKRLSSADKDGGVICPTVQRSDGHPDLIVSKEDMALIEVAPDLLEVLQDALSAINDMANILNLNGLADEATVSTLTQVSDDARVAINKALGKE